MLPLAGCSALGSASTDGPLPTPHDHGYGGLHVAVGEPFTDKFDILLNGGDEPVTITSVELIDTPRQVRLVEALVSDHRTENGQTEPGFPPTDPAVGALTPAVDSVLLPVTEQEQAGVLPGYGLVLGLEVTEPGRWVRGGYRVGYEVDGRPYELEVVAKITMCTDDFLETDGTCPMEGEGG